jgi:hypothetical protein
MSIAPDLFRPSRLLTVAAIAAGLLVVGVPPARSVESASPVSPAPAADTPSPPPAAAAARAEARPEDVRRPPADIPNASVAAPTPAPPPAAPAATAPVRPPSPAPAAATPPAPPAAPAAAAPAQGSINDDTARYLAGLPPAPGSPIAALARDESWREHARFFDRAFGALERTQLARIRAWSTTQLHARRLTLFYMFSGPDYLYADAFFPDASTYVLAGLEPVGQIPDLLRMPRGSLSPALHSMAKSMHTVLNFSFFKTHDMREELSAGRFSGTTPILLVFLARAGKIVQEINLVDLDAHGVEHPASERIKSGAHGVKIVFSNNEGRLQTLYYFSTNLADDGFARSGFMQFCEKLAPGDSLIKSASYLMHHGGFTKVRDFLIAHSATLLEDDSGIPLAYFDRRKWELKPFGRYLEPLGIFPNTYQPKLAELFHRNSTPINFGIGYRWRPNESNLLLAVREDVTGTAGMLTPSR